MKHLNKSQCSIPTLSHGDATVQTDIGKADLLNSFFSSCCNLSHSPLVPSEYHNLQSPQECPEEVLCNEEEVYQLLSSLDVTKANGPDGISARTLKHTATSITPSITKLFNLSLRIGHNLVSGSNLWLCQFPSQTTIKALPIITDQFPF